TALQVGLGQGDRRGAVERRGFDRHATLRSTARSAASGAESSTSGKWHATKWPDRISRLWGTSLRQISCAGGHRGWKRQPDGGFTGEGSSDALRRPDCRTRFSAPTWGTELISRRV